MATVTLNINGISEGWTGASGTATDIDEAVASADGSEYGGGANADAATFDLSAHGLSDSDVISDVSITVRMRDAGSAGTRTCDVDFLIGGSPQGTTQSTGALTASHADYGPLNDAGWNSDWTASQLDGAQVRLTPQQSGMPGTNDAFVDCVDVVITYSSAITADAAATAPQPTASSTTSDDPLLSFDGTSDYFTTEDTTVFDGTNNFTVEILVNPSSGQTAFPRIMSKEDAINSFGIRIFYGASSEIVGLRRMDNAGGGDEASQAITPDTESHVAFTYDGSNIQPYVEGSAGTPAASTRSVANLADLLTFASRSDVPTNEEFTGTLREIRIWDHARTSTQINAFKDKRLTGAEDGLVYYYRVDDGSGTTVTDATGTANGTITGATWIARESPLSDATAAAQATAPAHSAEAVVNVGAGTITANVAATAPAHSASAVAENPVSADTAATAAQASASAVAANPVTADVAATAPAHSASAVVSTGATADVAATAPAHSASAVANVSVQANAAATAPAHSASVVADVTIAAIVGATSAQPTANVVADLSVEANVAATAPQPSASASDSTASVVPLRRRIEGY